MAVSRDCFITRPGGFEITDSALEYCRFGENATLADIGCGYGNTLRHISANYGFKITGVELNPKLISDCDISAGGRIIHGDAHSLPFSDGSMDGLFYECSFSKMDDPQKILSEAFRVLVSGGRIVISDFYATGREIICNGALGRVETAAHIGSRLSDAGFTLQYFKDYTKKMRELWGQLIFEHGRAELCSLLGLDGSSIASVSPAYGFFIAVKRNA